MKTKIHGKNPGVLSASSVFPVLATIIVFATAPARAALLSYEAFDYPEGSSVVGLNGGFGFSQPWQMNSSGGVYTNRATSLGYTDAQGKILVTAGGSLLIQGSASADVAAQPNRLLTFSRGTNVDGTDGVTTWVSFLAVRQGPATNHSTLPGNPYPRSANLSLYNSGPPNAEKLAMGNTALTASNVVSLLPMGGNAKTSSVDYSRTNFIVVRIEHVVGSALDEAYLFVNPLLNAEPALGQADATSIGQFDFSFNRLRPFAGGNRPAAESPYAELVLDEIRIGETYADVAPFVPTLSITRSADSVVLTWPGNFNLQSATEVAGPYVPVLGATSPHTNDISEPLRFFRLSN